MGLPRPFDSAWFGSWLDGLFALARSRLDQQRRQTRLPACCWSTGRRRGERLLVHSRFSRLVSSDSMALPAMRATSSEQGAKTATETETATEMGTG